MQQKISAKNMNLWGGGERQRQTETETETETEGIEERTINIKGILHKLTHADTRTHNM